MTNPVQRVKALLNRSGAPGRVRTSEALRQASRVTRNAHDSLGGVNEDRLMPTTVARCLNKAYARHDVVIVHRDELIVHIGDRFVGLFEVIELALRGNGVLGVL